MNCRNCGTEIAEKALICFKCGTATAEAVHKPVVIREGTPATSFYATLLTLDLIGLVGLYLGFTSESDSTRLIGWALFVVATVLVVTRILARRR